jgi:hypothetical protein
LRQPKVVGEILAGVVLGPAVVGRVPAASWIAHYPATGERIQFRLLARPAAVDVLVRRRNTTTLHTRREARSRPACRDRNRHSVRPGSRIRTLADPCIARRAELQSFFDDHHPGGRGGRHIGSGGLEDLCRSQNSAHAFRATRPWCRCPRRYRPLACARCGHGSGQARPH